jgi:hypothetical protein
VSNTPPAADQRPPGVTPGGCRDCDATTPVLVNGARITRVDHSEWCPSEWEWRTRR